MDHSTIEILSRIDKSVAEIAKSMQPQNQTQAGTVTKLSRGDVAPDPSQKVASPNISMASIGDLIKVMSSLSPAVKALAKLDGKTVRSFNNVIDSVIKTMNKLSEFSKENKDALESANSVVLVMNAITKGINKMPVLVVTAPLALLGITMAMPVFFVYGKLLQVIAKMKFGDDAKENLKALTSAVDPIIKFTLSATLVVAACIGLGALLMNGNTKDMLLGGMAVLGGVLLAMTDIIAVVGLTSRLINELDAFKGIKDILLLTLGATLLVAVCMGLGAILSNGETSKILLNGLAVLGGVLVTMGLLILLTGLLGAMVKETDAMKSIGSILLFAFGSMAIIFAAKFLGDFAIKEHKSILIGLGATAGVMVGLVGIGWLAGKLLGKAKTGIAALAVVEGLAAGAMGLMLAAVKLSNEVEGKAADIALTVLGCMGVVTAFGALAAAASFIAPEIIIGSVALGAVELFALGAVELTHAILKFHQTKADADVSWIELGKDVLGMEGIMGSFGLLAAAFGLLIVPIGLAMPGMLAVSGFANKCIGITGDVINMNEAIKKAGGIDVLKKTVGTDMAELLKQFNAKNFKVDMSLAQIAALSIKFGALEKLTQEFSNVAVSLSKIGQVAGVIDAQGRISPVLYVDKNTGEIKYGEPVDIKNVADVISGSVKAFVSNCNYGFQDVKNMFKAAMIFGIIEEIIDPISSFVNVLTGFVGGTDGQGNSTLAPVHIDQQGKITVGKAVDIKNVASIIAGTVTSFVTELYKEENTGKWVEMMYGGSNLWDKIFHGGKNKKTQAISDAMGILGVLVTPVSDFVDMITNLSSSDGKSLSKILVNGDGTVKVGEPVDVVKVATAIVGAVDSFITTIYAPDKQATWASLAGDSGETLGLAIKHLNDFAGIMSIFSNKNKISNQVIDDNAKAISKLLTQTISTDMNAATPVLEKFNGSLVKTTKSMQNLDKVLKQDSEKRKKAINEFKDSIEELLKKFSGADDSISKLYELVMALQTMDANKVSKIIASMNLNNYSGGKNVASGNNTEGRSNVTKNADGTPVAPLTAASIAEAIRGIFDNATINGNISDEYGMPKNSVKYTMDVN